MPFSLIVFYPTKESKESVYLENNIAEAHPNITQVYYWNSPLEAVNHLYYQGKIGPYMSNHNQTTLPYLVIKLTENTQWNINKTHSHRLNCDTLLYSLHNSFSYMLW